MNDGSQSISCNENNEDFKAWVAEGNTPEVVDATRWDDNREKRNQISIDAEEYAGQVEDSKNLVESEKKQVDDYVFSGLENAPLWHRLWLN